MKKRFNIIIILVIYVCTMFSGNVFAADAKAPAVSKYVNTEYRIELEYPKTWVGYTSGNQVLMEIAPKDYKGTVKPNISLGIANDDTENQALKDTFKEIDNIYKSSLSAYKVLSQNSKKISIGKIDAYEYVVQYSMNDKNKTVIQIKQIIFKRGGYFYTFTYTATKTDFSKYSSALESIAKSLKLGSVLSAKDEAAVIGALTKSAVKLPVDGGFEEPYDMDVTEAMMFIVLKTKEELRDFNSLSDKSKKEFLNSIVQDNYGDYLGCSTVHAILVYDRKLYAVMDTGYDLSSEELTLLKFTYGEDADIIVQNREDNTYESYYN